MIIHTIVLCTYGLESRIISSATDAHPKNRLRYLIKRELTQEQTEDEMRNTPRSVGAFDLRLINSIKTSRHR